MRQRRTSCGELCDQISWRRRSRSGVEFNTIIDRKYMVPENRSHSRDLCTHFPAKRGEVRSTLWSQRIEANNGVFAGRRGCCERRNDARREEWPTTLLCQRDTFNERESVTGSCACLVLRVLMVTHILNLSSFRNFLSSSNVQVSFW
jgi:hypothetical protein